MQISEVIEAFIYNTVDHKNKLYLDLKSDCQTARQPLLHSPRLTLASVLMVCPQWHFDISHQEPLEFMHCNFCWILHEINTRH